MEKNVLLLLFGLLPILGGCVYYEPQPPPQPPVEKKVIVCHKGKNISIPQSALKAHLAHGDKLGPCP